MTLDKKKQPRGYVLQTSDGRPVCVVLPPPTPNPPALMVLIENKDSVRYFVWQGKQGYREAADVHIVDHERDVIETPTMLRPRGACLASTCDKLALEGTNFCRDHLAQALKAGEKAKSVVDEDAPASHELVDEADEPPPAPTKRRGRGGGDGD